MPILSFRGRENLRLRKPIEGNSIEHSILSNLQRIILFFLVICITGCSAWSDLRTEQSIKQMRAEKLAQIDIERCKKNGGYVRGVCSFSIPVCVIPFSDAGKPCADSSECEGLCWNEDWGLKQGDSSEGQCTANAQDCKCGVEIRHGVVDGGMCED